MLEQQCPASRVGEKCPPLPCALERQFLNLHARALEPHGKKSGTCPPTRDSTAQPQRTNSSTLPTTSGLALPNLQYCKLVIWTAYCSQPRSTVQKTLQEVQADSRRNRIVCSWSGAIFHLHIILGPLFPCKILPSHDQILIFLCLMASPRELTEFPP